jgi:DNA-binding NarL/FixJ family response regulator
MSALVESRGVPFAMRTPRFTALVVVADPGLRETVVKSLHALGAVEVTRSASVGETRARLRAGLLRDLVVVEVGLPDGSGVTLLGELRSAGWQRGIALSADGDPFSVRAALAAGARGFVVSDGSRAARSVGATVRPIGGLRTGMSGVEALSAREVEVLQRVASGRSNRDIGGDLALSALTVKSHLARIARKLGTGDRAEMVAVALRAGVIS